MKVVTASGAIELGTVGTAPTIGVIDYSRRVTDEFGVTTVVQRGFARRMTVRLAVPFDDVDTIQRQLAELRATSATWIADDRFGSLSVRGFYKEFEVDHATAPLSYCTLTVEGMTGEEAFTDDGSDPAPVGQASSLQLLQPIAITDAVLTSSSVAEDDAIEWTAAGGYALGQRVMRRSTHRVWESLLERNVGHDPATTTGAWLDVGPTNRWAMFDQALGSVTTDEAPIVVTLRPDPAASGLAILDCNAATVRVQAPGYDRTVAPSGGSGAALFLDLSLAAGASITVTLTPFGKAATRVVWDDGFAWDDSVSWQDTVAGTATVEPPTWSDGEGVSDTTEWQDSRGGDGTVFVGTLLLGILRPLGITEGSATSGITDYSRRETDEFGETMIVPRAWAKRMAGKALIRTDAVDQVVGRIAAVRAVPSLWLGDAGVDSLIVYGFFKDFSVEVGETLSKLTLSIEGFSEAKTPAPLTIPWENVSGTKPTENADNTGENTSKDTGAVAGVPATQVIADAASVKHRNDILENITIPAINSAVAAANALIKTAGAKADAALADLNAKLLSAGIALDGSLASADSKLGAARVAADLAVSRANTRIDAAMTDLNAEANRAQGKDELLERRIDSLTVVTNKNDGEVRALIETERLVRTDDVRAIAQRIDSVVTDYTSRDSVTNTRITTQVTALSAADRALGERIDTVTTEFKAADSATSTRIMDSVAALSAADEAIGKRVDSIVTDVTTKDTATRAEISRVELASSTRDTALGQRIDTVVTDYTGRDSATNTRITTQVTALSAADTALGERIDTVTTDFKAADTATSTRITQSVTALSNADTALGQRIDTITTDYKAADSATSTRITTAVAALSDADSAIGQRIDTITTDYVGRDTRTNARVDQTASAMTEADRALGARIETVQASFTSGGGNLLVGTDFITLDGWTYNQYNPSGTLSAPNRGIDVEGSSYHPLGEHTLGMYQPGRVGDSTYLEWLSDPFAVTPGEYLQFSAFCLAHRASVKIALVWLNAAGAAMFAVDAGDVSTPEALGNNPENYTQHGMKSVQVPSNAVGAYLIMRKNDTKAGANPNDSYAWFWRPSVSIARAGQLAWAPYSPGSGRAAQVASTARVKEATDALAQASLALGSRSTSLEAQMSRQAPSALNTFTDDVNNRLTRIDQFVNARINTTEDVLADLPNQYATAQRVSILEAQVSGSGGDLTAKIDERLTVVVDPKIGAVAQSVSDLRSAYNGTAATVSQQAGTLADVKGRTAAYWRTTAVAGDNRAQITISADANAGAGVDIIGDVSINGNLLVSGSVVTDRIALNGVTNTVAIAGMSGGVSPEDTGETGRVYITSTGGTMKVDVQADGTRTAGSGNMRAQLFAAYNGTELALSREVAFTPSNTAVPVGFFQIIQFPAGTAVQFFLRFFVTTTNTTWTYTSAAIAVTEFKR
ncbi:hypothetical protein C8J24_2970 [Sphingomonas aerolata]|uniref:DUF1983 domain-containing protein n=1 Tax=Sphingomonas aerolata TaxID=185951 RepID=A0A2T4YMY1_9SPHN|nr:hypothetical protein [Sphingomonas aerolata]PTM44760.1 hypothetical protein C8J24_2970 [Sphingomonas aerolata]